MRLKNLPSKAILCGSLTGIVNGLFGGGGGMIAVPLLKNLMGYSPKQSHATAILIIAPVCAASALTYIFLGYFNPAVVIPAALGSLAGGYLGAKLLKFLPEYIVNIIFVAVMLAAGIRLLF